MRLKPCPAGERRSSYTGAFTADVSGGSGVWDAGTVLAQT